MSREERRIIQNHLLLLQAIKIQAIEDGRLDEFEEYWLRSDEMISIWKKLSAEMGIFIESLV